MPYAITNSSVREPWHVMSASPIAPRILQARIGDFVQMRRANESQFLALGPGQYSSSVKLLGLQSSPSWTFVE